MTTQVKSKMNESYSQLLESLKAEKASDIIMDIELSGQNPTCDHMRSSLIDTINCSGSGGGGAK